MATIALLAYLDDAASKNIYDKLAPSWKQTNLQFESSPVHTKKLGNVEAYLLVTQQRSVYAEHVDIEIQKTLGKDIDALIFITKHDSKSGKPSFSVHTQGNWSKNELGGNPSQVATTPVVLKHILFQELCKHNNIPEFEVVQEATHHGPSVEVPSLFIEIGSVLADWQKDDAGIIVAKALESGLSRYENEKTTKPVILGLGGTHTCSNFMRLVQEDKALLSHVCPEYAINELRGEVVAHAMEQSTLTPQVIIDWKGMSGPQRAHVLANLDTQKIQWRKLSDLKAELDQQST